MEDMLNQRIMYILSAKDASVNALSKKINMTQTTLSRQVKGEQTLSAKAVEGILSIYKDVSAEWLMRGDGEAFLGNDYQQKSSEEPTKIDMDAEATPYYNRDEFVDALTWKSKYEELEKRYNQLLGVVLGGNK